MSLDWDNYPALAAALDQAHPDADLINLEHDELLAMISALPGFAGSATPPDTQVLDAILYAWVALDDDGDDGRLDAHA